MKPPSTDPVPPDGSRPSPTRTRLWLFRLAALSLFPLLVLLAEFALRLGGYGYNPDYFVPLRIGGEDFLVQNEDFSRRFFPGEVARQPAALRMAARKPPGVIRIFVLGESAAMGDPEPAFGPARYLEAHLAHRFPSNRFEIVNVAFTAINSHVLLPIARECARQAGDVWLLYIGNNEMVGPYGAATVFGAQAPSHRWVRLALALQRTRLGQLADALAARWRPRPDAASWGGMQMFLDNRVAPDSPNRFTTYTNFAANLADIVACGSRSGASVILNGMAVNLRDCPPFASWNRAPTNSNTAQRFHALLAEATAAETNRDWPTADRLLKDALALESNHAETHFRRARAREQLNDLTNAIARYQTACDLDALPFRSDSAINGILRAVARREAGRGVHWLDAPQRLAAVAGVPVCGDETFYEHVHFNFDGAFRLGRLWAEAVEAVLPPGRLAAPAADWPTQEQCERWLALTDWNRKLTLESMLRRLQQPPFTAQPGNNERIARLRQLEQAALARMNSATLAAARETFAAALAARPDDHFLHELHGNFLQVTRDLPGAVRAWQRAAELMPHDFLPRFQVGVLLARQGRHAEAEPAFRAALAIRPALVEGWVELARSQSAAGNWTNALAAFQRAAELRPRDANLRAAAARALLELNRTTEARAAAEQALRLQPENVEARLVLGDALARENRWAEAAAAYEAIVRLQPNQIVARLNWGVALARQGRLEAAREQFEFVLQAEPGHAVATALLRQLPAPSAN
jgi:tetratricopeptide (TPR) repeat protein